MGTYDQDHVWRTSQSAQGIDQALQAGALVSATGIQAGRLAVGGALGVGQLGVNLAQVGVNAAEVATRGGHTQGAITGGGTQGITGGYTDPAAAVAGGSGYAALMGYLLTSSRNI